MNVRTIASLLVVGAFSALAMDHLAADAQDGAVSEAVAAADRFYKAFLSGDDGTVSRLTADNFVQTDVNGRVQNKTAWLDEYYRPRAKEAAAAHGWKVFERQVEDSHEVGNVVVMVGTIRLQPSGDSGSPRTLRFTQVWARNGSEWQRAVVHNAWTPDGVGGK